MITQLSPTSQPHSHGGSDTSRPSSGRAAFLFVLALLLTAPATLTSTAVEANASSSSTPMLAAGNHHTCALLSDGTVRCWGLTSRGRLGDPTATGTVSIQPVQVQGLNDVVQISAGGEHTCAVRADGTAWCWGNGEDGQLGNGGTSDSSVPAKVVFPPGGPAIVQVSVGDQHTCAVDTDGGAWCWGSNFVRQLGDGTNTRRLVPVRVLASGTAESTPVELTTVRSISAGTTHTCALDAGGFAWCWGDNTVGRLGDGTTTARANPVQVLTAGSTGGTNGQTPVPLGGLKQVEAGGEHACALLTAGTVRCWGRNLEEQLGDGTTTERSNPVAVSGLTGVSRIDAGFRHTCGILTGGTAHCWGRNPNGELGDGTTTGRSTALAVLASGTVAGGDGVELSGVTQIVAARRHSCAVVTSDGGTARCWGLNTDAQLGDGTQTTPRLNPVTVLASGTSAGGDAAPLLLVVPVTQVPQASRTLGVTCGPLPPTVDSPITCTVTGGDASIEILWRVATNPTLAEAGVTLDANGSGTFRFTVPRDALGAEITVELVAWTAPVSLGTVVGPTPASLPAGEGPSSTLPLLLFVMLASVTGTALLGRRVLRAH